MTIEDHQHAATLKELACVWALKHAFSQDRLYIREIRRAFEAADKEFLCAESEFKVLCTFEGELLRGIDPYVQGLIVSKCLELLDLSCDYAEVILPKRHQWWAFWRK